jgi:hypothetical protein
MERRQSFGPPLGLTVYAQIILHQKSSKDQKERIAMLGRLWRTIFWANQIDIGEGIDMEHIQQFVTLWELVSNIHLEQVRQILLEVH